MKLYYTSGACSLAVHIALHEAGQAFEAIKVTLPAHTLPDGGDFYQINPRGYVPVLELDDGSRHTEVAALLQHVGDLNPAAGLLPAQGDPARLPVLEWLAYIASELHKGFSWLWAKDTHESTRQACQDRLARRFAEIEDVLAGRDYIVGTEFTVADAYAFTIINWANFLSISLAAYPRLQAYLARVAGRPAVQAALRAEGLLK
ncbi:MAG: glutathione transferase GstA [Perlucidibaca sp.]